ncbi:thiamine-phosphate synthase [Betaproteobacteria bacterium]|nr:thiamine-phosphate synthase [Betaproteobacteria bacterium]GHU42767.1 thiamine-phosphate synthase [Betaproteobacteria bacterium]
MVEAPLSGLYAVTPDFADTSELLRAVTAVLDGGCRLLQYRNKTADAPLRHAQATALQTLCSMYGARLIVNDDVRLAQSVGAAGVHLGRDDGEMAFARKMLGDAAIIGASCYTDFSRACKTVDAGASYIAFGAVYPSPSKPAAPLAPHTLIARARAELSLPVCVIGGITLENAAPLVAAGASLLAVISDLFRGDTTYIRNRAAAYQQLFQENPRHAQ